MVDSIKDYIDPVLIIMFYLFSGESHELIALRSPSHVGRRGVLVAFTLHFRLASMEFRYEYWFLTPDGVQYKWFI